MSFQKIFLWTIMVLSALSASSFAGEKPSVTNHSGLFKVGEDRATNAARDDFKWDLADYKREMASSNRGDQAAFVSTSLHNAAYPPNGPQSHGPFDH